MKKTIVGLLFCALAYTSSAQNGAIKINPLSAAFGNFQLAYEHNLNDKSTAQLNVGILSRTVDVFGLEYKYSGFQISPEYRIYFDDVMNSWYGGAFVNYNSVKNTFTSETITIVNGVTTTETSESELSITNIGGGILFGREWLLGSSENFVIDVNLGVGYQTASIDSDSDDDDTTIEFNLAADGVWPKFGFSVGYCLQ